MKKENIFKLNKSKSAFALAEILVALMITTMAIVLVGALSQQVMNMNKNSKQIAAVIEMRAKIAALSKNPDTFLTKMRAVIPPGSGGKALQSCIPFVSASVTSYSCPAVLNATELAAEGITNEDTENGRYKVSKTPVVDSRGAVIAPQYLTDNGSVCSSVNPATECPFMSEGYMFRENELGNPGDVKFVSRVSMNPGYSRKGGTTPLKPMLMSVELGSGWSKASTQSCSSSKVFQGIEPDGTTKCVDATKPCASGLIQVGYDSNGPLCENPSLLTCEANEKPILDPVGKKLICSSSSPCAGSGKVFTGFYAASGEPICENPSEKCTSGSIQMGTHSNNAPACVAVDKCDSQLEALSYNGSKFVCSSGNTPKLKPITCPSGQAVTSIDEKGNALCSRLNIVTNVTPSTILNPANGVWTHHYELRDGRYRELAPGQYICGVGFRQNCDFRSSEDACISIKICTP